MDAVERWFGAGFSSLHPLLQSLHRQGGSLSGTVLIEYGRGLAGWLGRRMASGFGLPSGLGAVPLEVSIYSDEHSLHWDRVFAGASRVSSVFTPVGAWPKGYWVEKTGLVTLCLQVEVGGGVWRWKPLRSSLLGVPVPSFVMPQVVAYKAVEGEKYRFYVGVSLPLIGFLFSYSGVLALAPNNSYMDSPHKQ